MSLSGWDTNKRLRLDIDSSLITSDLSDRPVLVRLSSSCGKSSFDATAVFDELGASKLKIAVATNADVECKVEIEWWDDTAELAILRVKVPTVFSSADTVLYLYYDSTHADNSTNVGVVGSTPGQAVWTNSYHRVYHLVQDPSGGAGCILDSTGNSDSTPNGTMTSGDLVDMGVGKGIDFDGSDDDLPIDLASDMTEATVEFQLKSTGTPAYLDGIFTPYSALASNAAALVVSSAASGMCFFYNNTGVGTTVAVPDWSAVNYISATINSSTATIKHHNSGNTMSQSKTSLFFDNDTRLSRWYLDSRRFPGIFRSVQISSVARTDEWRAFTYETERDNAVTISDSSTLMVYGKSLITTWIDRDIHGKSLLTTWDHVFTPFGVALVTPWRTVFGAALVTTWRGPNLYGKSLITPWRGPYIIGRALVTEWAEATVYGAALVADWDDRAVYGAALVTRFGVVGDPVGSALVTPWVGNDRSIYARPLITNWFGGGTSDDQEYQIVCTMAGVTISPAEIRRRRSRAEAMVEVKLAMAGSPELLPGAILPDDLAYLTAAERAAAIAAATVEVEITVGGSTTTTTVLATAIDDTTSVDGTEYTLVCESAVVLMGSPYSLPVSAEYGPGMAADIAASLMTDSISLSWTAVNWWITGGVFYGNAETPLEILRKPKEAIGGMIQSALDGDVTVKPYYPVSRKDWQTTSAALIIELGNTFFIWSKSKLDRDGHNRFLVGDMLSSSQQLTHREEDIERGIKQIKGFEIPWTGVEPPLNTSGPARVVIRAGKIVIETIEKELVEIVDGGGQTANPIYEIIDRDYGDNTPLGAISYGEDGRIETATAGQSLCLVTYKTRYWSWRVLDSVDEQVQLYSLPAWADMPITLVVQFGDVAAAGGFVVVEGDDTLNVDSAGNVLSELPPGQPFYLQLQHDDTVELESHAVSSGTMASLGSVTRAKTGQYQFVDGGGVELPYFPAGSVVGKWYGRSPTISRNGRTVKASAYPAIGELSYKARMQSFKLTPPSMSLSGDSKYYILMVLKMVSV